MAKNDKKPNLNDYRSMMRSMHAPSHLQPDVLRQADRIRQEHGSADARAFSPHRKTQRRQFAVAACVVLVSIALAFGCVLGAPSNHQPEPNSFTLVAYAAENPDGVTGKAVELSARDFGWGDYSGPWYDPEEKRFFNYQEWAGYKYRFDIACTGTNVQSITYEIEGEHAYFETIDHDKLSGAPTQEEIDEGYHAFNYMKSITLDFADQCKESENTVVNLYLGFPFPEAAQNLDGPSFRQFGTSSHGRFGSGYNIAISIGAAHALSSCKLNLTATFADGSTQTKTYAIKPAADFVERCTAYWGQSSKERANEMPEGLFSIAELAEG